MDRIALLQQYNHVVKHIPGASNPADAFSRIVLSCAAVRVITRGGGKMQKPRNRTQIARTSPHLAQEPISSNDGNEPVIVQPFDMPDIDFRKAIQDGYEKDAYIEKHPQILTYRNGMYYTDKNELYIPAIDYLRDQIMQEVHDAPFGAHFGIE